eukprot:3833950-Lingulodinium_polyedra.AAC.1
MFGRWSGNGRAMVWRWLGDGRAMVGQWSGEEVRQKSVSRCYTLSEYKAAQHTPMTQGPAD